MLFMFALPAKQDPDDKPNIDLLVEEYSKSLTRLCYILLKDVHLAEDAAWEALYKAYKGYSKFKGDCSEKTWITRIAINICNSYMRKSSYREISSNDTISLEYASDDEASFEFRSDESLALLNAVYSLPDIYRQVLLLRYYQQMSVNEIGEVLGAKKNTVSVRIKRAHDLLKEMLKEDYI